MSYQATTKKKKEKKRKPQMHIVRESSPWEKDTSWMAPMTRLHGKGNTPEG